MLGTMDGADLPDGATIIERFNNADEDDAMKFYETTFEKLEVEDMEELTRRRRKNYAETLSVGDLTQKEVIGHMKDREEQFIEEYADVDGIDLPEWLLRAEAQDVIMKMFAEEMGVI